MTKTLTLRSMDIPSIHKFGIGFDNMFEEIARMTAQQSNNYPPYNILKQSEDDFTIEIAAAGFGEGEVTISLDNRLLTIKGEVKSQEVPEYLHKGISTRSFSREFTLAEHVEVVDAQQRNGILSIQLKRIIPEEKRPKTIDINYIK